MINRPVFLKVPAFLLKLALSDMAKETLLANQTVEPRKLKELGFRWRFANLEDALDDLLVKNTP